MRTQRAKRGPHGISWDPEGRSCGPLRVQAAWAGLRFSSGPSACTHGATVATQLTSGLGDASTSVFTTSWQFLAVLFHMSHGVNLNGQLAPHPHATVSRVTWYKTRPPGGPDLWSWTSSHTCFGLIS